MSKIWKMSETHYDMEPDSSPQCFTLSTTGPDGEMVSIGITRGDDGISVSVVSKAKGVYTDHPYRTTHTVQLGWEELAKGKETR